MKDSELKDFFVNNYDTRPGRNDKTLEQILNLSEGSRVEVYLNCPKHPNENSCKMTIQHWCNPTSKPVCCRTSWNLSKIKHFIHSLLGEECLIDHLDTATFYIIMQRVGILETNTKWLPFLKILPKLERNEIMEFLSNSNDNIGNQLLESYETQDKINLDDMLVKLRRERYIEQESSSSSSGSLYKGDSLECLIQSIDLQLGVLKKQESLDLIGDNDIFNVIYAKYRDRLWKKVFDKEEECINEFKALHLLSDDDDVNSPAVDFIQNYFLKEYHRVKSLQHQTANNFPWTPKLMQCLIVARLENCFETPFPQMTTTSTRHEVMKWSHGIGNWSDTGTGKTLSALMCVYYLQCQISVIFCLNSITKQWADECEKFFPGVFRVKIIDPLKNFVSENDVDDQDTSPGRPTIYILSYSKFMETNAKKNMKTLVDKLGQINLIVLDEIHAVKIRYQGNLQPSDDDEDKDENENKKKEKLNLLTKRRQIIQTFVNSVRGKYSEVKTLGLTATPVVNNLMEAESQLSLLSGSTCERNKQSQKKFETNSPTVDSIMMIHRQLCLYGIRSLLDSEKGPDGKTSIRIRYHPNINGPCDDYIARFAVDATEQYIELLNKRVDTIDKLVGGTKANTLKLTALVNECKSVVSEGYKVIVTNVYEHGEGVLHFLKDYITKECPMLRVLLKSSSTESYIRRDSDDVFITNSEFACECVSSSRYKLIETKFIRKWTRLEVGFVRTKAKLPEIISICKKKKNNREKVLLFTNNIGGFILETLQNGLSQSIPYLRLGTFTGRDSEEQREENKRRFLLSDDDIHAIDVLIATEPITTGVDKLQEVCFSLIINLLPMTNKEFKQLSGRLVRFGQQSPFVDIYIPLTKVKKTGGNDDDVEYGSEDYLDIQRLLRKETLCDAAIDGTFPADIKTRLDEEKKDTLMLKWLGLIKNEGPLESNQLKRNRLNDVEEMLEDDQPIKKMMKNVNKEDDKEDDDKEDDDKEDDDKEDDDKEDDKEDDKDDLGVSIKKNRDEFTENEKQIVRERQKYTCNNKPGSQYEIKGYLCEKWKNGDGKFDKSGCDIEIDHIKALKNGGKTELANAQALCRNCHSYKTFHE